MKIVGIVSGIVLLYGAFATWFVNKGWTGAWGRIFGQKHIEWLGIMAYFDMVLMLFFLFALFRFKQLRSSIDFYLGSVLFFIALLIFQGLVAPIEYAGNVSQAIVAFLMPYIGLAGMWLFFLMVLAIVAAFGWDGFRQVGKRFVQRRATVSFEEVERKRSRLKVSEGKMFKGLKKNPFAAPKRRLDEAVEPVANRKVQSNATASATETKKIRKKAFASKPKKTNQEERTLEQEPKSLDDTSTEKMHLRKAHLRDAPEKTDKEPSVNEHTPHVPIVEVLEENKKLLDGIEMGESEKPVDFVLPKLEFLQRPPKQKRRIDEDEIDRKSGLLLEKLKLFNINGDIVRTYTGPLVTTFEFKPAPNVKVSKIINLQDDLAMALSAETIRIQAPIPGRDVVGIEIPNDERETIYLREILQSDIFQNAKSPLTIALGKDIVGNPFLTDIQKLPHLLIAGTTGSGKSVGINAMILSLLYKNDPDRLKLMMIDPKMLEFSIYDDIPHLITPVITEPKQAIAALANMVGEMERRYKLMAQMRTKNIDTYNDKVRRTGEGDPMPFIVVIIDELADLMMNGGKEVETSIARLAQKSRACGIHLIVATQRPSVDVVTGIIKANLPSRLSYRVGQKIDSKVILDALGAESLLGRGDGLFTPPSSNGLVRIHAPWATEEEIESVVEFIKAQRRPQYDESYLIEGGGVSSDKNGEDIELDPLYQEAKEIVLSDKKTSISYLQRKLQIGYNRAANLVEQLEKTGVLSSPNAKGVREIIV